MGWLQSAGREILRWYLRAFPLRNGKTALYDRFNEPLAPAERYVIVELPAGFRMKLDLRDTPQRKIFFYGTYDERHEDGMVRRVLEEHEVFWDIGANVGFYSLLAAALLQNTCQVVAFEPGKIAHLMLQENIALNSFKNISVYQVAVTDTEGEAVLFSAAQVADGGANLFLPGKEQTLSQTCGTVSLDRFNEENRLPRPDFIKMDVEGAELSVLMGADRLLREDQPLLLMEMKDAVLKAAGTDKASVQNVLVQCGYAPAFLHRCKWYQTDKVDEVKSRNIFWFKPSLEKHRQKVARIPLKQLFKGIFRQKW